MHEAVGWSATALFAASYLFRRAEALRYWQAAAALVWIAYGVLIGAAPVVAANSIVALAAALSARRLRTAPGQAVSGTLRPRHSALPRARRP